MNNKCGCGSGRQQGTGCQAGAAFMPVTGNWDFNLDGSQHRCADAERDGDACRRNRQTECDGRTNDRKPVCNANQRNACAGSADCSCDACIRRRETECETPSGRKNINRGVGIVWAWNQALEDVYDCGRALKAGTLYPELHKPMNGYCPCGETCGDKCQQKAFAMWELRLYLNTHPDDREALRMLHRLQEECCEPNYATTFLEDVPCTDGTRNPGWRWVQEPWPWEYDANCGC